MKDRLRLVAIPGSSQQPPLRKSAYLQLAAFVLRIFYIHDMSDLHTRVSSRTFATAGGGV
jgi:hypothetical protein